MPRSPVSKALGLSFIACLILGCAEPPADGDGPPAPDTVETTKQELVVLGGLELHSLCRRQHGGGAFAVLLQPVFSPGAAFAWKCRANGRDHHMDMPLFCKWQYNNPWASASFTDFNNAYSWYCFLP